MTKDRIKELAEQLAQEYSAEHWAAMHGALPIDRKALTIKVEQAFQALEAEVREECIKAVWEGADKIDCREGCSESIATEITILIQGDTTEKGE